jgi:hypothetical protein
VDGRNRRLQLIRTDRAARDGVGNERDSLRNSRAIPELSMLLVEGDQFAVWSGARRAPRIGQSRPL